MTPTPTKPSSRRKWLFLALGAVLLLCVVCVALVASSTFTNKYFLAFGLPNPDRAYQTGSLYGYNVYVWDCYQNNHIVLYHYTSEMTSGPFSSEQAACGATTPIETKLAAEKQRELSPSSFW